MSRLVLFGGSLVMARGLWTVLRCLPMMFGSFVRHNALLLGFARLVGDSIFRTSAESGLLPGFLRT